MLYHAKNLHQVKVIVERFEGSGISVTQTKVSLPTTDLATQLFKIKDQYKCLVKLIETVESTKYTTKRHKQSKNLTSEKTLSALTVTFKKECKTMT